VTGRTDLPTDVIFSISFIFHKFFSKSNEKMQNRFHMSSRTMKKELSQKE